ncbi:hypothetical protein ACHHYP_14485 [Achlya hypogyna]|uniref:Secreted protein n=1 Tax=Achlya hypogyna TaxID=1202772 RepID=A0A1V9YD14_ACHHY|nr:hypothetical protein ACHHYP_14485 [Achlya hypogyna]
MSFTCLAFSLATLNLGNYSRAALLGVPDEDVSSAVTPCSSTIENHANSGSFMVSRKAAKSQSRHDVDTSSGEEDDDSRNQHVV